MDDGSPPPTPESGVTALRDHVLIAAERAREALGPPTDERLPELLSDVRLTRYPVQLDFDASRLQTGELAWPEQRGADPAEGWVLHVHPTLRDIPGATTEAALYQLVVIIYGELAEAEHAELFGATLLGLDQETYYQRLCAHADALTLAAAPDGPGTDGAP